MAQQPQPQIALNKLPTLTGLRFVAALIVFVSHAAMQGFFTNPTLNHNLQSLMLRSGYNSVEYFFVLSGFGLTWAARPNEGLRSFWRRRAMKIFPNNVVSCLVAAALVLLTGGVLTAKTVVPNLLMVQSWVPDLLVIGGVNPAGWSMACQLFFYLMFPALFLVIRRIPARALWASAIGVCVVIALMPLIATALPDQPIFPIVPPVPLKQFWLVYFFPVTRVLDFALGIVMARIVMEHRWIRIGLLPAGLLTAVGYAISLAVPHMYATVATTALPIALLICAGATADLEGHRSPFRSRTMVWLGNLAFAFYMVHYLVLIYGHKLLGSKQWNVPTAIAVTVTMFAVTMVLAILLYRYVESPAMRRWAKPRRPRTAERPAPAPVSPAPATSGATADATEPL